jgi:hypothetical protein
VHRNLMAVALAQVADLDNRHEGPASSIAGGYLPSVALMGRHRIDQPAMIGGGFGVPARSAS